MDTTAQEGQYDVMPATNARNFELKAAGGLRCWAMKASACEALVTCALSIKWNMNAIAVSSG